MERKVFMAVFYNRATLLYNDTVTDSNVVTGELVETLSVTKTPLQSEYSPDSVATYIVTLKNSGTTALSGLTLTDNLGAYTIGTATAYPLTYISGSAGYFINGTAQAAPTVVNDNGIVISGISVPAGGNTTVIYQARVNDYASPDVGGTITNTVTVSGDGISDATAVSTITAEEAPVLSISKSLCPTTVSENGVIAYTFVIDNIGNAVADEAANVIIADTFNPILRNIVVTLNGTTLVEGTDYTYNEATGEFATIAGRITVPAAGYAQDSTTGLWTVDPATITLVVSGTV